MSIGLYFKNDVKVDEKVKITLNSGAVHTGKVISYDDNIVVIAANGRPKPITSTVLPIMKLSKTI
jgi:hypothetical protein